MNKEKAIKICNQVSTDMDNDAKEFDGKPFNGTTVAQYFGYHEAAIAALAEVLKFLIEEK